MQPRQQPAGLTRGHFKVIHGLRMLAAIQQARCHLQFVNAQNDITSQVGLVQDCARVASQTVMAAFITGLNKGTIAQVCEVCVSH